VAGQFNGEGPSEVFGGLRNSRRAKGRAKQSIWSSNVEEDKRRKRGVCLLHSLVSRLTIVGASSYRGYKLWGEEDERRKIRRRRYPAFQWREIRPTNLKRKGREKDDSSSDGVTICLYRCEGVKNLQKV